MRQIQYRNNLFILFNSILDRVIFFLLYLFLARTAPKSEYGFIATIFAFTNILQAIFDLGLPFYIQREVAIGNDISKKINSIFYVKIISLILYVPIPLIYFAIKADSDLALVLIISLINFCWGMSAIFNSIMYGYNSYKQSAYYLFLSRLVLIISFSIIFLIAPSIENILLSFLISFIVHSIFFVYYLKRSGIKLLKEKFDSTLIRKILSSSILMGVGVIFVLIYDRSDVIILQRISGLESVAFYSAAYSIYRSAQVFGTMIIIPKYSSLAKSFSINKRLVTNELKNILYSLFLIGFTVIPILFFFSTHIIKFLFSAEYIYSASILKYLSFGFAGVLMNNFTGVILNSIKKEKIPAITTGLGAAINIILNIILISKFGVWGAVVTTIATEYLVFIFQLIMLIYYRRVKAFILE
ncbi:MAG: oligosaccharide flippase family protein [Ignavibacteriaceae bacterium]